MRIFILKQLYKTEGLYEAQAVKPSLDFYISLLQNLSFHLPKFASKRCTRYLIHKIPQSYWSAIVFLSFPIEIDFICSDRACSAHTSIFVLLGEKIWQATSAPVLLKVCVFRSTLRPSIKERSGRT